MMLDMWLERLLATEPWFFGCVFLIDMFLTICTMLYIGRLKLANGIPLYFCRLLMFVHSN